MQPAAEPAGKPVSKPHLNHIDGIRAVAALVVYFNHAYAQTWNVLWLNEQAKGAFEWTRFGMVLGPWSVTVFIVVSGFCLALPVVDQGGLRGGVLGFFKRRARRILPPYYAAVFLCLALIYTVLREPTGALWDTPLQVVDSPFRSITAHLLLVQDLFATSHINYVFWSIAVEWQLYFVMPALVWGWYRFGPGVVVPLALVLGYAIFIAFAETRVARAHPHYLGMFTLGMLGAFIARSNGERYQALRKHVPWGAVALSSAVVAFGTMIYLGVDNSLRYHIWLDFPVCLMTTALLVASSQQNGAWSTRVFGWRPLVFIGTFSYSLYLVHAPLLQLLWKYAMLPSGASLNVQFMLLMTIGLAITLAASYGFHLLFEAPFMKSAAKARQPQPSALPTA
jgi:peptidoglycan/LPS O-acetylase OafA/YrhL